MSFCKKYFYRFVRMVPLFVVVMFPVKSMAACMTQVFCMASCTSGSYCCYTGSSTTHLCPTGWTYVSYTGVCQRSSTVNNSDDIGYYDSSYSTCSPTTRVDDCYEQKWSSTYNGTRCSSCLSGGIGLQEVK